MEVDIWRYRDASYAGTDITGFGVEALDGSIGKIDKATDDTTGRQARRGHRSVDLRQEGHASGRGASTASTGTRRRSTSTARRTRSRARPSTTTRCTRMRAYRGEARPGYYGPGGRGYRDWPLASAPVPDALNRRALPQASSSR